MTGLTRAAAAQIIAGYFNTTATHVGGGYDTYTVRDDRNRQWKLMSDSSIRCQGRGSRAAGSQYEVEFVSPICQYEDIETIQELVRKLRTGGAKVNDSCGLHIHVDSSSHTPKTLRNIVNIMASKEDMLYKALQGSGTGALLSESRYEIFGGTQSQAPDHHAGRGRNVVQWAGRQISSL